MIKNVYWSSCKVPVILVRFERNSKFLYGFSKNARISIFMKIRPVEAGLFHADGQRDMTKLKSLFVILRTRLRKMNVTLL